jgi:25S rRNA (uracil2634-N3)-methyltransferase
MGKGKNLKAALQSQQSRLKAKQKLSHAAQVTEQKAQKNGQKSRGGAGPSPGSVKGKGKAIAPPPPRRITVPFRATDKILLIGEGNFSFARALVLNPPSELESLPPANITATAYDTEDACYDKYPDAQEIVKNLKERGVEVLFGVDGTRLERIPKLKGRRWDRVVWNFPHAGQSR